MKWEAPVFKAGEEVTARYKSKADVRSKDRYIWSVDHG
jgi:hypothetical protein